MVVTCICCLTIGLTACGEKAKTVKSVEVNSNGELVAIYDNEEKVTLGKLSNVRSAEEKDGKLVITLVDGKTIEVPTKIDVPEQVKSVKSITAANGVLTITYTDGTTETVKVADKAVKSVAVKDGKLVVTLFDGTTEEVPLPSEKAVKDVTYDAGKIKITYTDGSEEILSNDCKHENSVFTSLKHHTVDEEGNLVYGYGIRMCPDCGAVITEKDNKHDWVKKEVVAPTCLVDGFTRYECSICHTAKEDDIVAATGEHEFGEYYPVSGTNVCEEATMSVAKCAHCDATDTRVEPAKGHKVTFTMTEQPTATEKGHVKGECSVCHKDDIFEYDLPVLNTTNYTVVSAEREKCTDIGKDTYTLKEKLGGKYEFSFVRDAQPGKHTYLGKQVDDNGVLWITDEDVAEHNIIILDEKTLTCDEEVIYNKDKAVKAIFNCDKCDVKNMTVVVAKKHSEKEGTRTNVVEATCTAEGSYSYECAGCGKICDDGVLPKIPHTYDKKISFDKVNGIYHAECECGDVYEETGITDYVVKPATCKEDGSITFTLKDGTTKTVKNGEKFNGHVIAYEDGKPVVVNHKDVDSANEEAKLAVALDYAKYKDLVVILDEETGDDATCKHAVKAIFNCVCEGCGAKAITVYLKGDHVPEKDQEGKDVIHTVPATCEAKGYTYYHCTACDTDIKYNWVDELGHQYEYTVVKNGDEVTALKGVCKNNPEHVDEIPCTLAEVKEGDEKEATCKEAGYRIWTCTTAEGIKTVKEIIPVDKSKHVLDLNGKKVTVSGTLKITAENAAYVTILDEGIPCKEGVQTKGTFTCAECGAHPTIIVTADHTPDPATDESTPAACGQNAHLKYTCKDCGHTVDEDVPGTALEHEIERVLSLKNGKFYATEKCKKCDYKEDDVDTELAIGSAGVTAEIDEPTCVADGKITYTVVYKNETYTVVDPIAKTPDTHDLEDVVYKWTAKGEKDGKTGTYKYVGKLCKNCGKIIIDDEKTEFVADEEVEAPDTNA